MKHLSFLLILALLAGCLAGCTTREETTDIVATTLPVYQFTTLLCEGTGLTVTRLVTENVSCLHDYSLNVRQVKAVESAGLIIISGAGLEDFMEDILSGKNTVDASAGISLLDSCHDHSHDASHDHEHTSDAHIWLSPVNALAMAENIFNGLCRQYPQHQELFSANWETLQLRLQQLLEYGQQQLSDLSCREMITFHDGFTYFADCFDLEILAAVEEESGSEASAQELIALIELVRTHQLPAVFTEENGSDASAKTISSATGAGVFTLNMAMSGDDYFSAMYHNIDCIKEAMG